MFRNTSPAQITLQLGFPEYRCEDTDADCVSADSFRFGNMRTEVRGEPVAHRKGKVSGRHAWAPRLGGVWLFDVTFEPGETVPVHHSYQVPGSYVIDGTQETTYVTRTGALWVGPIGHALFRVRLPLQTTQLYEPKPDAIKRAGVSFPVIDGKKVAELRYEARDWSPHGDLSFAFREGMGPSWDVEMGQDPMPEGPARSGLGDGERCQSFGERVQQLIGRDMDKSMLWVRLSSVYYRAGDKEESVRFVGAPSSCPPRTRLHASISPSR